MNEPTRAALTLEDIDEGLDALVELSDRWWIDEFNAIECTDYREVTDTPEPLALPAMKQELKRG